MRKEFNTISKNIQKKLKNHKILGAIFYTLSAKDLWFLHKHNIAKACFIGFFWSMQPIPFQMLPSILCALLIRANLAISIILVWVTNPITILPIMFANYFVGTWVMGVTPISFYSLTHQDFFDIIMSLGRYLVYGSLIVGLILGVLGFISTHLFWFVYIRYVAIKKKKIAKKRNNFRSS